MTSMRDASESVIMSGFFEEVQRRKVYRVAAAYIISGGIHSSDRIGCFPGVGIAKLGIPFGGCAITDRSPNRIDSRLGLRRHAARDSGDSKSSGSPSAPQSLPPRRHRRDNFYRCGIFSLAARLGAQDRQIGGGAALSKSER